MARTPLYEAKRRCRGVTKAGKPCRSWALWDDPRQLCVNHAGRHHRGKMGVKPKPSQRARYPLCACKAYSFPHRPGGGLCRWPEKPLYRLTTPPSTKTGESWWGCSGEVVRMDHDEPEPRESYEAPPEVTLEEQLSRYGKLAPTLLRIERGLEERWRWQDRS